MTNSERCPVIPWPQSFYLLSTSAVLQFIGVVIAASSTDTLCARIAFSSSVIALAATIGSVLKFKEDVMEMK